MGCKLSLGIFLAGLLVLAGASAARAQTTITYTDTQTNLLSYDTTGNPLTLTITSGFAVQSGVLSGSGSVTKTGAGTLTLSGTNTYGGGTTISSGTLQFAQVGSLAGGPSNLYVNSGATAAFNVGGVGEFASADIDNVFGNMAGFLGGSYVGLDTTNGNFTYNGTITDTSNGSLGLTKRGINSLTLGSGASTFSGGVTVTSSGELLLGASSTMVGNTVTSGPVGTGTLTLNHAAYLGVASGSITLGNPIYLDNGGNGYAGIDTSNGNLTLTGNITEHYASQLQISGSNTLTLSGNSTYTLNTILQQGTLLVGSSSTGGPGDVVSGPIGTGYLDMSDDTTLGVAASGGPITLSNDIIVDSIYDPVTFDTSNGDLTLNGYISGSGPGVIKTGGGTLTLNNGSNDFVGGLTVTAGTLVLGASSTVDSYNNVLRGPVGTGMLTLNGDTSLLAADSTTITLDNPIYLAGGGSGLVQNNDDDSGNLTLTGFISGPGGFDWCAPSTLTLTNASNTFSGGVDLREGTLLVGASSTFDGTNVTSGPVGTGQVTLYDSTTLGVAPSAGDIILHNSIDLLGAANIDTTNGNLTLKGVISDTGGLTVTGGGTLALSGANTYSGGTSVIESSTLLLGSSTLDGGGVLTNDTGSIATGPVGTGDIKLYDGATLGVANGAGPITLANTLELDCRNGTNVTIDTTNGNLNLAGVISGEAGLTLTGGNGNSLALLGNNTFSGGLTVNSGSLLLLGSNTKNSDGTVISDPSQINSGPIGTGTLTLNDGAILSTAGNGDMTFANNVTLSGSTGVTIQLNNVHTTDGTHYYYDSLGLGGSLSGSAPINLYGNGNLQDGYHGGGNLYLLGDNSGWSGGLNIYGNDYVGVFNQNGLGTGPLWFYSASSSTVEFNTGSPTIGGLSGGHSGLDYHSTVEVDNGITLTINQTTAGIFAGVITGAGSINFAGNSTLILTGANTYTGNTVLNTGELDVSGGSIGTTTSDITVGSGSGDNATLGVLNAGTVTSGTGNIALLAGSIGAVNVSGAGSSWTNANYLYVGEEGTGSLTISNGGTVTSPNTSIGNNTGGTGTLTVTGSGSTLNNTSTLYVGAAGSGTLMVQNGGAVTNGTGSIGNNPGGTGSATVDGAGSSWTTMGNLVVGDASSGTLTVTNGGHVSSTSANLGGFAGITGSTTISGSGSSLAAVSIDIGYAGNGSLLVASGGTLDLNSGVGTLELASQTGSTGTLNIGAASTGTAAAGGIVDAASITTGSGTGALQFNTTATYASPYYLTKDGTSGGTAVTISGSTQVVNTGGYNVLTGANTYTGGTTLNGGTLVAGNNSALGTGAVTLAGGQLGVSSGVTLSNSLSFTSGVTTLSGNGTIGSHVTAGSHVILSPGNSPGDLTFSAGLTLANLGEYDWQLQSVAGAPLTGAGTNWDVITVTGGTLDLPTSGMFTLKIISLNSGGTAGNVSDFNGGVGYTWTIATATGGITGNVNNIAINTSLFSNIPNSTGYSLSVVGNDLDLTFTPVPEPSTYALMALGLGCVGLGVRRKVRRR